MNENIHAIAVSDTHGNIQSLSKIAENYSDFKYLFHLGDFTSDADWLTEHMPETTVISVKGNCDYGNDKSEFERVIIKNQLIILTHGHKLKVKHGYDRALYYALENKADALLFGHTHIPYTKYINGLWLINPGSAGEFSCGDMSVCVLLISDNGIIPKIVGIEEDNPLKL